MPAKIPDTVAQKIQGFCDNRAAGDENLNQSSTIYKQIVDMTNQFLRSSGDQRKGGGGGGGMTTMQKVLTLVGIHGVHGTEQSVHFAITAAMQAGASQEQIMDSLDLALLTGGGGSISRVQFAINVLEHYRGSAGGGGKLKLDFLGGVTPAR